MFFRLTGDPGCSPQSSSSTCGSPPVSAPPTNQVLDPLVNATATSCITSTNLSSSWSILADSSTGTAILLLLNTSSVSRFPIVFNSLLCLFYSFSKQELKASFEVQAWPNRKFQLCRKIPPISTRVPPTSAVFTTRTTRNRISITIGNIVNEICFYSFRDICFLFAACNKRTDRRTRQRRPT